MIEMVCSQWSENLPITVVAMRASCELFERLDPDELRLSRPSVCKAADVVGNASVAASVEDKDENEKDDAVIAGPHISAVEDTDIVIGSVEANAMLVVVACDVTVFENDGADCDMLVGFCNDEMDVDDVKAVELETPLEVVLYVMVGEEDMSPFESASGAGLLKAREAIVICVK